MKRYIIMLAALVAVALTSGATTRAERQALNALLERIGGKGAHKLIITEVNPSLRATPEPSAEGGATLSGTDRFEISSRKGKPLITGSTLSATTAGLGWYLRHFALVDISWQQPSVALAERVLPLPAGKETHTSKVDVRYYLNYCTFSYSMSTWTWERWQQEIDWMALHGINAPLQIVGLDVVWRNLLTSRYGYTPAQANEFIAGPCFQAWWGMNNLEGWGGPNPDWWYTRQERLCKQILARQRQLGMEPVLPGYAGMVPSSFTSRTGIPSIEQGKWCRFTRPYILDPNAEAFAGVAADYYRELHRIMGSSRYYSIDPFHEGANTKGVDVPRAYRAIYNSMNGAAPGSVWVIQQWQWSPQQRAVLEQVPEGQLLVLDLFSDGRFGIGTYGSHSTVFCSLPNFGARTGLFGRLRRMTSEWFRALSTPSTLTGIGTAPEGIGQNQVQYDLLYELPWMSSRPDLSQWIATYAAARYGTSHPNAVKAWQLLEASALNCSDSRQGPHEAMMCGRPEPGAKSVSSWGNGNIHYNPADVLLAARTLAAAPLEGSNYCFDLVDVSRQALTDHGSTLRASLEEALARGDKEAARRHGQRLCELISDVDSLLCTHPDFMIGSWTESARAIAAEAGVTSDADLRWLELTNARTLITTWGDEIHANAGGLRDYSYRQFGGILRDYYLPRWQQWLAADFAPLPWFPLEHAWATNPTLRYPLRSAPLPASALRPLCLSLLAKYLPA